MVTDFIHLFDDAAKLKIPTFFKTILGAVRKLCHLGSGMGGQKLLILLSKKTTEWGVGRGFKIAHF